MLLRKIFLGLVLASLPLFSTTVDAAPVGLRLVIMNTSTSTYVTLTDQVGLDSSPVVGVASWSGVIGGLSYTVVRGSSFPTAGPPSAGNLADLGLTFDITNIGGVAQGFNLWVEDDGYGVLVGTSKFTNSFSFSNSGGGTTTTFRGWANAGDSVPAFGPDTAGVSGPPLPVVTVPGGSTTTGINGSVFGTGTGSMSASTPFLDTGTFSLFSQVTGTISVGGSAGGTNLAQVQGVGVVPEPSSMLILGGLLGAAGVWRRRRLLTKNLAA